MGATPLSNLNTDTLPICFVLLNGSKLIATAALKEVDIYSYQSVTPWLSSVIVAKQCRGKGIGSKLMELVMNQAKNFHNGAWYLFTEDQINFYTHHGWERIDEIAHNGAPGIIMRSSVLNRN